MKAQSILLIILVSVFLFPTTVQGKNSYTIVSEPFPNNNTAETGSDYWAVRNATSSTQKGSALQVENAYVSDFDVYGIKRAYLRFNTTELPDHIFSNPHWQVKLWLRRSGGDAAWLPEYTLKVQNWTDGADGVDYDDYSKFDDINYDDGKAFFSNWGEPNSWNYVLISNTSLINPTGWTYIVLRHSADVNGEIPTDDYWMTFSTSAGSEAYLEISKKPFYWRWWHLPFPFTFILIFMFLLARREST